MTRDNKRIGETWRDALHASEKLRLAEIEGRRQALDDERGRLIAEMQRLRNRGGRRIREAQRAAELAELRASLGRAA